MSNTSPTDHSEIAYSWPAIPFGLAIVFVLASAWHDQPFSTIAIVLLGATLPALLIRDWWVSR